MDSIWWRDLSQVSNVYEEGSWFKSGIDWKIGYGSKINFWEDGWLDGGNLSVEKCPCLYNISRQHHYLIQQLGSATGTGWEWQLEWRRHFSESKIDIVAKFMEGIEAVTVQPNQQDRWGWKLDPSEYTQREVLTICYPLTLQGKILMKCSRKFGRSKFQVSHFSWRLIRDRLPTKMNLKRRNVDSNDFSCLFFRSSDEDASHSFFNCDKILPLW